MIKFKFTDKDTEDYNVWCTFYPKRNRQSPFRIELEEYGYFDPRPQFNTNVTSLLAVILPFFSLWFLPLSVFFLFFGWGDIYLRLPYDTGNGDEAESPEYGAMTFTHSGVVNELWVYWGKKRKHIQLPWSFDWVRTSTLLKDNEWFHETKDNRLDWSADQETVGSYEWLKKYKWQEIHPYTDSYDRSVVNSTISVKEREWRPLWFKWTSLFSRVSKDIEIEFDKEVGERKGSWKGGCLGCGYEMKEGETPLETLRRMEIERKF